MLQRQTVQDLLEMFGKMTSDEIANYLEIRQITGDRFSGYSCPLANYFKSVTGEAYAVGAAYILGGHKTIRVPASIKDFVGAFDQGQYPKLVDTNWPSRSFESLG